MLMRYGLFAALAASFLKIGAFGFGGGYAMLPFIQHEMVNERGWITDADFTDMVALSQTTPGPIAINAATFLGYTQGARAATDASAGVDAPPFGWTPWVAGLTGALLATLCVCLPPFVLMYTLGRGLAARRDDPRVRRVMRAMRPVVVGLIAAAAAVLLMAPANTAGWGGKAIFAVALVLALRTKIHPVALLAGAGFAGYWLAP